MPTAEFQSLCRVQGCVYTPEDHPRSTRSGHLPEIVTAERISGVNADSDYVTRLEAIRVKVLQRLVPE